MLILAGVSIAMLTGENGILTQASKAKEQNEIAEVKEQAKLDIMAWRANEIANGRAGALDDATVKTILDGKDYVAEDGIGDTSFTTKEGHTIVYKDLYTTQTTPPAGGDGVKVGEILTGTENKTYTKNGTAKIPVGFMIVPGCDDVSQGLVISDNPNDREDDPNNIVAEGNQFVWIPVIDGDDYIRNTTYSDTNVSAKAYTDEDYLPDDIQTEIEEGKTDAEIGLINEKAERDAVVSAGGFYIGRYEAGDSSASDHRSSSTITDTTAGTLVSKKNVYAYSYIKQEDAKEKAKTFKDNDYVKSSLISGIQWDVTMATINGKKDGKGNDYDVTTAANDSNTSDRHTGSPAKTGQNVADKVYNIYDLEGNFMEYVAEKNTYDTSSPYVYRGGFYDDNIPASDRYFDFGFADSVYAFRLSLYVM